ncbi:MAG: bifunctional diguanylate cyclase/phosphodiesterase, partial [Candidatus Thiodiazotropha sp.]
GDKLLVEVAKRLRDAVREGDTIGRFGGDEFVVLLNCIKDSSDAHHIARMLLNCFKELFHLGGRDFMMTASLGISIYPNDGKTGSELLRSADVAMYHAKEQGGNTYCYFTDEMNRAVFRCLLIDEQLHGALERGEFHICFQPLVEVQSNKIIRVEALLRWDNHVLGSVPPSEFIPVAEQSGLIDQLGRYVISKALSWASNRMKTSELDFKISVNLSPSQFRDLELVPFIKNALEHNSISGSYLELEITEGVLLQGGAYVDEALKLLNQMGISLAMDDFGTGYSSLSQLRRYPFDVLKIDQSFIHDIISDDADRQMVNSVIAMAHGMGLEVVAEGVESEEQLEQLSQQRCDMVQGFLISPPLLPDALTALLM